MHTLWLILHIMAGVVAFGPAYTQPFIAARGRRNPQHAVLAAEISAMIATRFTIPFGLTMAVSGAGLMATEDISLFDNAWLWVSVLLYAIALTFALAIQTPNAGRTLKLLTSAPPGQPPGPDVPRLGRNLKLGGMFLLLLTTVIFVLMIWQPGGGEHVD